MKKYLAFIGVLELISFVIFVVFYIIAWARNLFVGIWTPLITIGFILFLIVGPSLGILFIQVSKMVEEPYQIPTGAYKLKKPVYLTHEEVEEKIEINRNLLKKGIITEEEFSQREQEIRSKEKPVEQKTSE